MSYPFRPKKKQIILGVLFPVDVVFENFSRSLDVIVVHKNED
jgi:hypothetical protein